MNEQEKQLLETAEAAIERARSDSKQPRFKSDGEASSFLSFFPWMRDKWKSLEPPPYILNSRKRDKWLREYAKIEPHWQFVLKQVVQIDANRGWLMIGGRNQVRRYTNILHNAENGAGWRTFAKKAAMAYRTADLGTVVETGRDTKRGPLRAIYNVDPARCRLTGDPDKPLKYSPVKRGAIQQWPPFAFFRAVSLPSTDEGMFDLGWCATSIAVELIRLFYGVFQHDQEMVGAQMPEALMILQGISEPDWQTALAQRRENLTAKQQRWFGNIMVIAGSGLETAAATLVALSQLPANFDRRTFIDMSMYAYAGVVGYAPSEFWPVSAGNLGRGREEEIGAVRTTSKGGKDWALSFQDRFQRELPETLQFEFEERDDVGRKQQAEVARAWADVTDVLRKPQGEEPGTITREEARTLLVDNQVLPADWTEAEEDSQASDTDDSALERIRQRALASPEVMRAVEMFPREQIVRYYWDGVRGTTRILWACGEDALHRRSFPAARVTRQTIGDDVLAEGEDWVITQGDVDRALVDERARLGDKPVELMTATEVEETGE